jgi:predicted ArsR family transcriptional regulator
LLAEAITTAQRDNVPVDDARATAARAAGRAFGLRARRAAGGRPTRSALTAAMIAVLTEAGYEPRDEDNSITLVNCPFHGLAQDFTDLVCGMNLHLIEGIVDGLGDTSLVARLEPTPGVCCVRLTRSPEHGGRIRSGSR